MAKQRISQTLKESEASALKLELYNKIGEMMVDKVKSEMLLPRMRYTKRPRMAKSLQYNTKASGNLYNSVRYEIRIDDEGFMVIDLLMNDYGVDYVYGDGSLPGGGLYAKDTRTKEAKQSRSPLIDALTRWASNKLGLSESRARSMAFAVRKNLFKYGYGSIELFPPQVQNDVINRALQMVEVAPFDALPVDEELRSLFDRVNTFGNKTYSILI